MNESPQPDKYSQPQLQARDLSFVEAEGEGNFRPNRRGAVLVAVGIAAAAAAVALAWLARPTPERVLSAQELANEKTSVAHLPIDEARVRWRKWAVQFDAPKLQEEAFAQLAWLRDPEGLTAIVNGLGAADHRVRGTAAAALLEYGPAVGDAVKPALLKALQEADSSDRPQIVWALSTLHEPTSFRVALSEYRAGHLATVQRLDGRPAFDPEHLSAMVSSDALASLAADESESVRELVATILSKQADAKFVPELIKLVQDESIDVAREAAVGLGKIGTSETLTPLLRALGRADKDSRQKFLEALRDGIGGKGLVLALQSVDKSKRDTEKFQTKVIFDLLHSLQDPRAADALVAYLDTQPPAHWRTEAALRLAEIGDVRAVPTLAWRLRQEPLALYSESLDPEYRRTDDERVMSARMLADLAVLWPDKRAAIRSEAYSAVLYWLKSKPQPHANGMRFFAASEAKEASGLLRSWASPAIALPKSGQTDFPSEWVTAQSALRYVGWLQDASSWPILEAQLRRRPERLDVTMDALLQGGNSVLGMSLRAIGVGAADGFAQWGSPKAFPLLTRFIEDKQNNEQSRLQACFGLAWVATADQMQEVVSKIKVLRRSDKKTQFIRACYLESLVRRPMPALAPALVELLDDTLEVEVQHQAARAIGIGGMNPAVAAQVFEKLRAPSTRTDAALAILLGGNPEMVRRMFAFYNDVDPSESEPLKIAYAQTFGYWSAEHYERGDVARWIDNAKAAGHVRVRDALQDWPEVLLARALGRIDFDNGPHSVTRVQMRVRLLRDAKDADEAKRQRAIKQLAFMKEQGVLMALRAEQGPWQMAAREALFEMMNPKITVEPLSDSASRPVAGLPVSSGQ